MEKKPRRRTKPKGTKANKASDIPGSESESDVTQLDSKAAAPDHGKGRKKQVAKTKTKAKKRTSNDTSKKTKAKAKKALTKAKTKAKTSKSTAFSQPTKGQENLTGSTDTVQEKGAESNKERSPKSSVEMTVINIDDTLAEKSKKKGWWTR